MAAATAATTTAEAATAAAQSPYLINPNRCPSPPWLDRPVWICNHLAGNVFRVVCNITKRYKSSTNQIHISRLGGAASGSFNEFTSPISVVPSICIWLVHFIVFCIGWMAPLPVRHDIVTYPRHDIVAMVAARGIKVKHPWMLVRALSQSRARLWS